VNDMTMKTVSRVCAALAICVLLVPAGATAQSHGGGGRAYGGGGSHGYGGGSHGYGGYRGGEFHDHDGHGYGGWRGGFGIYLGPGWDPWWWGPYAYPAPYYYPSYPSYQYYTPPVVIQQAPVYSQQVPEQQQEVAYWYYCQDPPGYYPYVRQCPRGWTRVVPTPNATPSPPAEAQAPPPRDEGGPVPQEYRWYYCQDPPGYYPYIQDCPKGWTRVSPIPGR
jgi:hypothetical protein